MWSDPSNFPPEDIFLAGHMVVELKQEMAISLMGWKSEKALRVRGCQGDGFGEWGAKVIGGTERQPQKSVCKFCSSPWPTSGLHKLVEKLNKDW